jgi:hypothetical protein
MPADALEVRDRQLLERLLEGTDELRRKVQKVANLLTGIAFLPFLIAPYFPLALLLCLPAAAGVRSRWQYARRLGAHASPTLATAMRRLRAPCLDTAHRLNAVGSHALLVRFSDDNGAHLDLLVPLGRVGELRGVMARRFPAAHVDLDRDLVDLPAAIARIGDGKPTAS